MCKNFTLITSNGIQCFESIGDLFINRKENKEHAVSHAEAERIHHDAMNKASYVRMRKHENEIIL